MFRGGRNSDRTLFFTDSEAFLDGVDIMRKSYRTGGHYLQQQTDRELDTIQSLIHRIDDNCAESIFDKTEGSPKQRQKTVNAMVLATNEEQPIINFEFKNKRELASMQQSK